MKVLVGALAAVATLLAPAAALARGGAGDPRDRLDASGTPTDRYLGPDELRDALHAVTDGFYACHRDHLRGTRDAGDVAISFTVERDGTVRTAAAELDGAPAALGPCLEGVVRGLRFPTHDGDPVEVSYPLVHQVDRAGARILPYPVVFTRPRLLRLPLLALPLDASPGELSLLERVLVRDDAIDGAPATPSEVVRPAAEVPADSTTDPADSTAAPPGRGEADGR